MGIFISNTSNVTVECNGEEISTTQSTRAASDVVGAQVGKTNQNTSDIVAVLQTPVMLNFTFNTVENGSSYRCVYWNFSDP